MTNQTPESVIAEVLDEERYYDRDQISNESRAAEIVAALRAANMLREAGLPDGSPQAECSERPGGRPCESGKPEHKTHWSNGPKTADACHCTPYSEDRGGGYFELMLDPEPDCPEHGEMIAAQVQPSSAVLEAAAADAPQAPKDIHEPNHDRVYCVRCGGNWPCQPAPLQPSSNVDIDELREVIAYSLARFEREHDDKFERGLFVAHAVVEYLTGGTK